MATRIRLWVKAEDGQTYRRDFRIESDLPHGPATKDGRLRLDDHWFENITLVGWNEDERHWIVTALGTPYTPMSVVEKPKWHQEEFPV